MKYIVTPSELMDRWLWDKYCSMTETNEWCVKEGLMDSDEEIVLTEEEYRKLTE